MLSVQLTIAQCTHKSPAILTRQSGPFLGMIEAARFALDQNRFTGLSGNILAEECGKDFDLLQRFALAA